MTDRDTARAEVGEGTAGVEGTMRSEGGLSWRCFHCDYVTASKDEARAHFGNTLTNDPTSCLLMKLEAKELIIDQLCAKLNERAAAGVAPSDAPESTISQKMADKGYTRRPRQIPPEGEDGVAPSDGGKHG